MPNSPDTMQGVEIGDRINRATRWGMWVGAVVGLIAALPMSVTGLLGLLEGLESDVAAFFGPVIFVFFLCVWVFFLPVASIGMFGLLGSAASTLIAKWRMRK